MLLLLNCAKEFSPPSSAAAPAFLQKGKTYDFYSPNAMVGPKKIIEVESNGWIKIEHPNGSTAWVNTNTVGGIEEAKVQ